MEYSEKQKKANLKILLYGIGRELDIVEKKIRKEHEIIGYMDSFAKIKRYRGRIFYELHSVDNLDFDYVIITLKNRKAAWEIQKMLTVQYGIPLEKIIPFYVYANREVWRIKMHSCELEKIQGLILGNSFALTGFLEDELNIPFINLSVSSQDLYYCYRVFCQCMEQYGKQLCSLKYIVIDLWNYMIFNVDTSRGGDLLGYLYSGGIHDEHNFSANKKYIDTLQNEMFKKHHIILKDQKQISMQKVFDNWDTEEFDKFSCKRWGHIQRDAKLQAAQVISVKITKKREDTFQENINVLERFMQVIRKNNADVKIIFTLIPQYTAVERGLEPFIQEWKEEFYRIVTDVCECYHAFFWDFKTCKEISENYMFYYDELHLNTVGARAMTEILNKKLSQID